MRKELNLTDIAGRVMEALPKGILLNTRAGSEFDSMVIGWGSIGYEWARPVFTTYVRTTRRTHDLLEQNPEFTISLMETGVLPEDYLRVCGFMSGRNVDKAAELGMILTEGTTVTVPGIKQVPLTLECRVIYRQTQDLNALCDPYRQRFYTGKNDPEGNDPDHAVHTAFIGEITAVYSLKDE